MDGRDRRDTPQCLLKSCMGLRMVPACLIEKRAKARDLEIPLRLRLPEARERVDACCVRIVEPAAGRVRRCECQPQIDSVPVLGANGRQTERRREEMCSVER